MIESIERLYPTTMDHETIGKRIQMAREEAGISQYELASRSGFSQSAVSHYELGRRGLRLENLRRIAEALNKPLACFLEEPVPSFEAGPRGDTAEETASEMRDLISQLSPEENEFVLEYLRWMVGRRSKQ
ncbi:MAG: helix-turn-helix transcriptional regulator [Actinomycetota bacterium]